MIGAFATGVAVGSTFGIIVTAFWLRAGIIRQAQRDTQLAPFSENQVEAARVAASDIRGPARTLNGRNDAMGIDNWAVNGAQIRGASDLGGAAIAFFIARGGYETPEAVGARFGNWWHGLPEHQGADESLHEYFASCQRAESLEQRGARLRKQARS